MLGWQQHHVLISKEGVLEYSVPVKKDFIPVHIGNLRSGLVKKRYKDTLKVAGSNPAMTSYIKIRKIFQKAI